MLQCLQASNFLSISDNLAEMLEVFDPIIRGEHYSSDHENATIIFSDGSVLYFLIEGTVGNVIPFATVEVFTDELKNINREYFFELGEYAKSQTQQKA